MKDVIDSTYEEVKNNGTLLNELTGSMVTISTDLDELKKRANFTSQDCVSSMTPGLGLHFPSNEGVMVSFSLIVNICNRFILKGQFARGWRYFRGGFGINASYSLPDSSFSPRSRFDSAIHTPHCQPYTVYLEEPKDPRS